jgi:hypothetical protein
VNRYTPGWLALIGAGVAYELHAVAHRSTTPGGSLSSLIWRFSDRQKHPIRRRFFVVGWVVLTGHFLWRWIDV